MGGSNKPKRLKTSTAYLSLGTNLGNREYNLLHACELIETFIGHITRKSKIIETQPLGFESDNLFLNMCIAVETQLTPQQLLEKTQNIEIQSGRTNKSHNGNYSDRIIDIDILLYDNLRIKTKQLTIPHPRMYERDFVMIPLSQIIDKNQK